MPALVVVEAPQVTLTGGAEIASGTSGAGQGGKVRVTATETVSLEASRYYCQCLCQGQGKAAGDAGMVVVEAPRVTLTGGAQIGSLTFGLGQGGRVTVRATELVSLDGSYIFVDAFRAG